MCETPRARRAAKTLFCCFIGFIFLVFPLQAALEVNVDFGGAFPGSAGTRAPAVGGTPFSISGDFHADFSPFVRFQADWAVARKHSFSGTAAPLRIHSIGAAPGPLIFTNTPGTHTPAFAPGEPVTINYRMDTYRLGYQYTLIDVPEFRLKIGLSARFRSGAIKLRGIRNEAECPNSDIFPSLHYSMDFFTGSGWTLLLDGDSLIFKDGYGHDLFAGIRHDLIGRYFLRWGWRMMLEKKDTGELYAKAWINLVTLGVGIRL